ncbi:MAG: right-handed parallel beta-helix repeat-containing protein [Bacilli bacterium]
MRNCYFHDNRARGILILARDVTIENCKFRHNEMGAIKIETRIHF